MNSGPTEVAMTAQASTADALDERVVTLLRQEDALTVPEIAADLRVTPGVARGAVKRLVAAGHIRPAGVSSSGSVPAGSAIGARGGPVMSDQFRQARYVARVSEQSGDYAFQHVSATSLREF